MKRKETADAAQRGWYRLDNAALVYSAIQRSDYSAVYRFSLVLDRDIDPAALRRAAEKTMPRFPGLCVRVRRARGRAGVGRTRRADRTATRSWSWETRSWRSASWRP